MRTLPQQQNNFSSSFTSFPSTSFLPNTPIALRDSGYNVPPMANQFSFRPSSNACYGASTTQSPKNIIQNPIPTQNQYPLSTNTLPYTSQKTQLNLNQYSSYSPSPIKSRQLINGQSTRILTNYPTQQYITNQYIPSSKSIFQSPKSKQITNQTQLNGQSFKTSSKIQYIPITKKIIEYKEQKKITSIPKTKKVINLKQQHITQVIPRQKTKLDYYVVQHLKGYRPQYFPQKTIKMVQKAVTHKKIQYVPVTRQIYHGAPLGNALTGQEFLNTNAIQNPELFTSQFYNNYNKMHYLSNDQLISANQQINFPLSSNKSMMTACTSLKNRIYSLNDHYDSYIPYIKY